MTTFKLRTRWMGSALLTGALLLPALPAHAENKDLVRIEAEISDLKDAVSKLQQSNDERMGVLKDLVQQTSDAVNKMTVTVGTLDQQMNKTREAAASKNDALSGQIQALNDSVDELKARLVRMEKVLADVQSQQAQASALLTNLPGAAGPAGATPGPAAQPAGPVAPPPSAAPDNSTGPATGAPIPMPSDAAPSRPTRGAAAGPGAGDMYRTAYSDFMAGKQQLAASEFNDLIKAFPDDNLSGNAFFYLGELDLRGNRPSAAIHNYDQVMERYPSNAKIPAAHLHKAQALAQTRQNEAAARELRALIARYPQSPEAAQARSRLPSLSRR